MGLNEDVTKLLVDVGLDTAERQRFLEHLVFSAAMTAPGPHAPEVLAVVGKVTIAAGVKELDSKAIVRAKLEAYLAANPPDARALAAWQDWLQKRTAASPAPDAAALARLGLSHGFENVADRSGPAPEGTTPAGPLARFKMDS